MGYHYFHSMLDFKSKLSFFLRILCDLISIPTTFTAIFVKDPHAHDWECTCERRGHRKVQKEYCNNCCIFGHDKRPEQSTTDMTPFGCDPLHPYANPGYPQQFTEYILLEGDSSCHVTCPVRDAHFVPHISDASSYVLCACWS
jgi:hypothetical protein